MTGKLEEMNIVDSTFVEMKHGKYHEKLYGSLAISLIKFPSEISVLCS